MGAGEHCVEATIEVMDVLGKVSDVELREESDSSGDCRKYHW